jgi:hypothetical protein
VGFERRADKYVFMEQSVNNPEVDKVLIICDKTYANKANNREGGVVTKQLLYPLKSTGRLHKKSLFL